MSKQPESRVTAEETTTLPEGTVLSVYRTRVGKVGHEVTKLVALHGNKRVEMTADQISPQHLRTYLELVRREIARQRALLTAKPLWATDIHPKTMTDFVRSMAFNDMFIFETLTIDQEAESANNLKPTKKLVSRRRKAKRLPQVLPDSDGTVQGSGETETDS